MKRLIIGLSSLVLFVGCKGIFSQDPSKIFADGKMPEILRKLANQVLEFTDKQAVIQRVQADQNRRDLMRVAVIDNGADITHPDLINKIAFSVEHGELVGAGYDVMGQDRWGSPQLIDPSLFAFGSAGLVDGKISQPPANPLDILKSMNDDFIKTFKAKVAADPELAASFFGRLNETNFSIVGARSLLEEKLFDEDRVEKVQKENKISMKTPPALDKSGNEDKLVNSKLILEIWVRSARMPLSYNLATGLPNEVEKYEMTYFEHVSKFKVAIKAAMDEVDGRSHFRKAFENFNQFNLQFDSEPLTGEIDGKLARALAFKNWGTTVFDPIREVNLALRKFVVKRALAKPGFKPEDFTLTEQTSSAAFDDLIAEYERQLRAIPETKEDFATKLAVKTNLEALPKIRALKDWYLKARGWEKVALFDTNARDAKASAYRRLLWRSAHPFLDRASAKTSHSTHVSGIIAAQDERIRIFPVRVLTQGINVAETQGLAIAETFERTMKEWLQDPIVARAVQDMLAPIADAIADSKLRSNNPALVAEELMSLLHQKIQADVVASPTSFLFVNQVIEAIRVVGREKIKIANISLGAEYAFPVIGPLTGEPSKILENAYQFLKFELFKYKIGQEIQKSAPKTIFVVAAGNSNKWVDGRSQSALPVDLSSPFLAKFEDPARGLIAPNNHIKNVIGVGSLSITGELSSFTNILLSKRTPFVMAEGESVLSPIRRTDPAGVDDIADSNLSLLSELPKVRIKPDYTDLASIRNDNEFRETSDAVASLILAIKKQMVVDFPEHRGRMSGTSMASPTATGIISKKIIQEAVDRGESPEGIYDNPDFAPEVILKKVMEGADVMAGDLYIPLRKLTGQVRPEQGSLIQRLAERLTRLRQGDMNAMTAPLCRAVFQ